MRRDGMTRAAAVLLVTGAAALGLYRSWLKRSGAARPERVGYPPLGTPKYIDDGLWIVDDTMVASGLSLPIRMTVLRLDDGSLLLHSPTTHTPALEASLNALGTVRHLVAPGTAHWTHLTEWQKVFPQATTWAVPGLRNRLQVRLSGVRIDRDLDDREPAEWQPSLSQGLIRGAGFCESFLFHVPSRTLILCDTIQNLVPSKLPPVTRFAAQAACGTEGKTAHHVRMAFRLGGPDARANIDAMLRLQPERVLFAHGDPFEHDAAARLRRAFAWMDEKESDPARSFSRLTRRRP